MSAPALAAIVGPTAVGKSATALAVARKLGAEIVSVDSMQIYVGMDIGTDKPPAPALRQVAHHLVDVVSPTHDVTVAEFQAWARAAIAEIARRGRLPLLVGGSGLYFRAVVDDLSFPPRAAELRAALEAEAASPGGREALYRRLRARDPEAASRMEPTNTRRVVRALEILELTEEPLGDYGEWRRFESIYALRAAGLRRPRAELYARIEERVRNMLEAGLEEEARRLEKEGLGVSARQALGYRQVLDAPGSHPAELQASIVRATKRFARRQESWFRRDPRIEWFDASTPDLVNRLVAYLSAVGRVA